ncbi:NRAMP family divalent metal transporter [Phytohalomonas tamaricis]|uniref:NRAMP family divalent metal transporter n=1 Tax=Phytohalomonas tamaricis TaxID=2081032 RepID=UPI000D0BE00C|nr:NRAMP family divalent metal transporter [Phytohalomonas tamaricis]
MADNNNAAAAEEPVGKKRILRGAIFLMATSSIGPAFLTQTSLFTQQYLASFAFAILISILIDIGAQLNIWRVITVSKRRGQDVANHVLPGLGHLITAFIVLGGIAFNVGNIAGAGLGLNALFGIPPVMGAVIAAVLTIVIFVLKNASKVMDIVIQLLGLVMLFMLGYVMLSSHPPLQEALYRTFVPESYLTLFLPIITLVGGTVGGYITFSGGHRLIEAGITGESHVKDVTRAAVLGIVTASFIRICLFLAALGVVSAGGVLEASNPAASVFGLTLGELGYRLFGLVLFAAGITSVIGAAYTSVSFMYSLHESVERHKNAFIIGFIVLSTFIFTFVGRPVKVLVIAGAVNALVLPIALGTVLIASRKASLMGSYRHPSWMIALGLVAMVITLIGFWFSFQSFIAFWQA